MNAQNSPAISNHMLSSIPLDALRLADGKSALPPVPDDFDQKTLLPNRLYKSRLSEFDRPTQTRLSDIYLQGAEGLSGKALLLGFGNGGDYSDHCIEQMVGQFEHLTVADNDPGLWQIFTRLMGPGGVLLSELPEGRVSSVQQDLTGLENRTQFIRAANALEYQTEYLDRLRRFLNEEPYLPPRLCEIASGGYDYIISSLILSQLLRGVTSFTMQCGLKYSVSGRDMLASDPDLLSTLQHRVETDHVNLLASLIKPGGRVCWIDTVQIYDFRKDPLFKNPEEMVKASTIEELEKRFDTVAEICPFGWRSAWMVGVVAGRILTPKSMNAQVDAEPFVEDYSI